MTYAILATKTVGRINSVTGWGIGLLTALLTLRAVNDFLNAYADPEVGFKEAWRKCKNRTKAVLIALTADSLIIYIKFFYGG